MSDEARDKFITAVALVVALALAGTIWLGVTGAHSVGTLLAISALWVPALYSVIVLVLDTRRRRNRKPR